MDSEEPEVTDAPLPACTEAIVSVAAAESARVTFDGDYVAGPMLFTDTEVTLVKISSEDYTTEDFCTVPMPACLGTVTVGDVLYAACSDGATSILAKCSSEGEYLGAIEITAQLANDMTAYDGMIYLTDTSMNLENYSPLGMPQLICIDIETEEVSYINLADYGLVAANGVTISPEMTVIVPDMYSPLILEFSTEGEKIGEYQLDIGTDGIVYSPSLNGYVVGNAYGLGVYLVKEDFSEYTVVSTETCAAGGVEGYPAEEPETSDCTDCVSQDQFDELYSMVMSQQETIEALEAEVASLAGLEETVTEVDQAMMDMATCMAAYVSSDDDEPEDTEAPEPETTMPEMTDAPTFNPSMMMTDEPTFAPSMMTTDEPTMMPTEMPTMMTTDEPTMMPTDSPTMMPTDMPTKAPVRFFVEAEAFHGMVCEEETRTFKNTFESAEACAVRCDSQADCMYFSFKVSDATMSDCIGCSVAPSSANRFTPDYMSYMMSSRRRQLSEVEALRRENAALKEALRQLRRN